MDIGPIGSHTGGKMRRAALFTGALLAVACTSAMMVGSASADGTATGHVTFVFDCNGLGTVTISVPNAETKSRSANTVWSAGQIVGSREHLLPTSFSESVVDVTTGGNTIFSIVQQQANGNSHPNQQTTACSFTRTGTFSQLAPLGTPLPPGVSPTDTLRDTFTVTAILQP
jgi:hypothetical protein